MLEKLKEAVVSLLENIIIGVLLATAAVAVITFAYFVIMACWRGIGSGWKHIFSAPWP